ncbi:replication-associated protein [robinz virus RP_212]|nr:replication-associated protein [robinz virus RP_212]
MPATHFSFDGTHVFLTYPQCSLEREGLRDFLRTLVPDCNYIIGRELHEDGSPHLHAYAHFGGRRRFTGANCFDVEGFHPNIQKPRRAKDCIAYCRKEDATPLVSDGLDGLCDPRGSGWADVLAVSSNKEEFLGLARERFPRDYVLSIERLLYFCEWRFGKDETVYSGRNRDAFREPVSLTAWVNDNLLTRACSLVLIGESRWGKTQWARSLEEKHTYMCGLFNLDEWSDDSRLVILDDIDPKFFPHWRGFLGCQKNITVTDKYRKKRRLRNGLPCIWLCNEEMDPRRALPGIAERRWLDLNCKFVILNGPLF